MSRDVKIGTTAHAVGTPAAVNPADISLPDWQRGPVDEAVVNDLAESISSDGLLHPPTVRRHGGGYQLIAGHHRLEAMKKLGAEQIVVMVTDADDRQAETVSLIENLKRRVLKPAEKAVALARLRELMTTSEPANTNQESAPRTPSDGPAPTNTASIASTAKAAGVSRSAASRAFKRQENASPEVIAALDADEIRLSTADELTKLSMPDQARILPQVKTMTRREVRNLVQTLRNTPPRHQPGRDEKFVTKVETFLEDVDMYVRAQSLSAPVVNALTKVKARIDELLASTATP